MQARGHRAGMPRGGVVSPPHPQAGERPEDDQLVHPLRSRRHQEAWLREARLREGRSA